MLATHRPPVYRCVDCDRPIEGSPPTLYLCPSCQETAAEAQRDHQVREAAHDMLAVLVSVHAGYHLQLDKRTVDRMEAAIAKARGGVDAGNQ